MTSLANEYILLDYAKSNRCKCQLCSQPIKLETLKIGHVINRKGSSRFEKKVWYHLGCMTQMIKGERNTQLDIVGLYSLRESDQKLVKTKFEQLKANGYQKRDKIFRKAYRSICYIQQGTKTHIFKLLELYQILRKK
ncbi:hypothetical protein pb186bvf_015360 [Paramecium bursaria]